jgi:hypothetical protein
MKPIFRHDCEACSFLGHYEEHDLYYCPGEPTVIARYGSEGPDYKSGLVFANETLKDTSAVARNPRGCHHLLRVAWLIAKDMDVTTKNQEKARIWHPKV